MRVSLTLTATSQVHINDEGTSVTLRATPTGEATTASTVPIPTRRPDRLGTRFRAGHHGLGANGTRRRFSV